MNLSRVRSLMVCVLPLSLPLFAACTAALDGSADGKDTGEGSVGVAAQAIQAATGWPMPNPVGTHLPNSTSYTSDGGHVVDNVTGLWWQGVAGCAAGCTQVDAAAYCEGLTLDGYSDWRLPTRIELVSIVDDTKHNSAIDPVFFPNTLTHAYWASTAMVFFPNAENHFKIGGSEGNTAYGGSGLNGARCVRAVAAAPASELVIQGDGTVLDTGTRLTWQRTVSDQTYTQSGAKSYCDAHTAAELPGSGWRLPSMKELQTIVDDSRTFPAIDPTAFPSTPIDVAYWTSTLVSWKTGYAWHVLFNIGQTNHDLVDGAFHVRCVADDHGCFIAGTPYTAGTVNPANACQVCSPSQSTSAWSNMGNGTDCSDGSACTTGDTCSNGACVGGPALHCDDGNACTDDSCNPATGCVYTNNTASCDDGDACTRTDTCQAGACVGSNPVTCAAEDRCHLAGSCDPGTGVCSNPLNGTCTPSVCVDYCLADEGACDGAAYNVYFACLNACQTSACDDACAATYAASLGQCTAAETECVAVCDGSCSDGVKDHDEKGVDCGGSCPAACAP